MRNEPTPSDEPIDDALEPAFDLRRGLKVLLIVGAIVTIVAAICIGLDSRYGG